MIIETIFLLFAIPAGFFLSWIAKDEIVQGRRWFMRLMFIGLFFGIWSFMTGEKAVALTCIFIAIASYVSYHKSFDKKFVER